MTCREKAKIEHPDLVNEHKFKGGVSGCPYRKPYRYVDAGILGCDGEDDTCRKCWDQEVSEPDEKKTTYAHIFDPNSFNYEMDLKAMKEGWDEEKQEIVPIPTILDSGNRREFESGAVRDIQEGKGRCDLLPLDVVNDFYTKMNLTNGKAISHPNIIFIHINEFKNTGDTTYLYRALAMFATQHFECEETMLLEVSIHFEEGAKKYGDNNWQKGIPVRCYIDSAVRHYLKFLRGDKDEPHDRAFCWNILCAIWTCKHHPELNEYRKEEYNEG